MKCFIVGEPDYSNIPKYEHDWESGYTPIHENIPSNAPEPFGNFVTMIHYVDANLIHDIFTSCSVTRVLRLLNQTPIDYMLKHKPL